MQDDWRRTPGHGKYARPERERRFLLAGPPPTPLSSRSLEDRYLDGTRLRLRMVQVGSERVYKLTQKVRPQEDDPAEVDITNLYLSAAEHERLSTLPAAVLIKTRHLHPDGFVVDEFHGALSGLRLVEIEVADLTAQLDLPEWVGREVTADDAFSGGSLARASSVEVMELLRVARRG